MAVVTIVCWSISAVAILGLVFWILAGTTVISGNGWSWSRNIGIGWESLTGPYEVEGIHFVKTDGLDSMRIDWVAGEVTVNPYDGADIQITELAQRALLDDERLQFNISGSMLTVEYQNQSINLRRMPQKKLEVLVPQALAESFDRLTVGSTSGRIHVSDINAATLGTSSVSGAAELSNITAQSLEVRTTSGTIMIDSVYADGIKIGSVSGTIRASNSGANILDCSTTSGTHNLSGSFYSANLSSVSGRIMLENSVSGADVKANSTSGSIDLSGYYNSADLGSTSGRVSISSGVVPSMLKTRTTSGSISVTVPNEGVISINHSSTSGKLTSDIPITMQNSGAQFNLSTVSGSVRILVYE